MYTSMRVRLVRGDLCRVISYENEVAGFGEIIEFCYFSGSSDTYNFKTKEGIYVSFKSDLDFEFLLPKESILNIIDIALDMKDRKWFDELCLKLKESH